jgi:hypothetical protein
LTCSKTASIPQKHPPAKTAVCWPLAVFGGVGETADFGVAELSVDFAETVSMEFTILLQPASSAIPKKSSERNLK